MTLIDDIQGYTIHQSIGQGGMSTIYVATNDATGDEVAIKMLRLSFLHDPGFIERFRRESDALTELRHPAIVPVYDTGDVNELPYIVMKYMPDGSLKERIREGRLTHTAVLHITERIAAALDFIHDRGIIHRDVKPSNMLFDSVGEVYLSDFGLVRMVDSSGQLTGSGVIGTPAYMAPENSRTEMPTHAADVYSLGVVLYEMLTGQQPYMAATPVATLLAHLNTPIPPIDHEALGLPPDVVRVVRCALAKDPRFRYQRAGHLAADLRAAFQGEHLEHLIEPPPQPARTERLPLGGASPRSMLPLLLAAGGLLTVVSLIAIVAFTRTPGPASVAVTPTVPTSVAAAQPTLAPTATITPTSPDQLTVGQTLGQGVIQHVVFTPDENRMILATTVGVYVYDAATFEPLWFTPTSYPVRDVAVSPTGGAVVAITTNGRVAVWSLAGATLLAERQFTSAPVSSVGWGQNAIAIGFEEGSLALLDPDDASILDQARPHTDAISAMQWSPDGSRLALASFDGTLSIVTTDLTAEPLTLIGHLAGVAAVTWAPDGSLLISGSNNGEVFLWDAETGQRIDALSGHTGAIRSVVWSSPGTTVATGALDNQIILWDVTTRQQRATFAGHNAAVTSLAFGDEGASLVSAGAESAVIFWDVVTGEQTARFEAHSDVLRTAAYAADTLAVGTRTGSIVLWGASPEPIARLRGHSAPVTSLDFNEQRLVSGSTDGRLVVWNVTLGEWVFNRDGLSPIVSVALSPDSSRVAVGQQNGSVTVWDVITGEQLLTLAGHAGPVLSVDWSPDGAQIVSGADDQTAIVWDIENGSRLLTFGSHTDDITAVRWAPSGQRVASASADASIIVWDARTGQEIAVLTGHANAVTAVGWSPMGEVLASGGQSGQLILWDVATWTRIETQRQHTTTVNSVSFGPDSTTLYTASDDGTVIQWALELATP